jgi:magnesium and cobalt transporter
MSDDEKGADEQSHGWLGRLRDVLRGEPSTREELLEFLRDDRWERVLDEDELEMLRDVLEVSETQVRDVMVPRSQMVVLEAGAPQDEILATIIECGHSRFPVLGEERDEVQGILLAKDLLRHFRDGGEQAFSLDRFLRPAVFIPESKRLNTLLKQFRVSRNHMAIVVDEYGGIAGLLTIEDVLEEIVGEIDDEHDPRDAAPIQQQDESRYNVKALTRIEDFNEYFDVELTDSDYDTVGGLVIHQLGRMPRSGDVVAAEGFRFKVLQADRRRVYGVEVTRLVEES